MTRLDVYPIILEDCAKQWRADQDTAIEMTNRAEAAEARAAQAEKQIAGYSALMTEASAKIDELRSDLAAEEAAHRDDVAALNQRIKELVEYIDKHNQKTLSFLDNALNEGDGVYRP